MTGDISGETSILDTRKRLVVANSYVTAILRMSQLALEHENTVDHAIMCYLLEPGAKTADSVASRLMHEHSQGIRADIAKLAKGVEARLLAVQIHVAALTEAMISRTLRDPGAYSGGECQESKSN